VQHAPPKGEVIPYVKKRLGLTRRVTFSNLSLPLLTSGGFIQDATAMEYLRTPTFPAFRRKRSTPFPPEVKLSEGSRRKPSFFQKAELLSESRASFRKPSFFQKAELLSESRASFRKPSFFQKAELLSESRASFRKPSFFQKAELLSESRRKPKDALFSKQVYVLPKEGKKLHLWRGGRPF